MGAALAERATIDRWDEHEPRQPLDELRGASRYQRPV